MRIPVILGTGSRYFIFNSETNPEGIGFRDYTENPDIMFEYQVRMDKYKRFRIQDDHMMGLPEDGWTVNVDFQNYFEAAWLGSPVIYIDRNVPSSEPFLNDDNKNLPFDRGIPEAFAGLMGKGRDYYEYFLDKSRTFAMDGVRVTKVIPGFLCTDGPFTTACNIRGTTEFCCDLLEDGEYAHRLLKYLTDASIYRLSEWRKYMGLPVKNKSFGFADDSIMLLSCDMYREFVLPCHKKLVSALSEGKNRNSVHLCGDASRHFKMMRDELDIGSFDTGFLIRHGELVKELGPDVEVWGGPHIELLMK